MPLHQNAVEAEFPRSATGWKTPFPSKISQELLAKNYDNGQYQKNGKETSQKKYSISSSTSLF